MRYYARKRPRPLVKGAIVSLALIAGLFAMTGQHASKGSPTIYVSGLQSADQTIWIALALALMFSIVLLASERRRRDAKYLGRRPNGRANMLATIRPLAVILGAAAIIVGALASLYSALRELAPELLAGSDLPFSFQLAIPALVLGGLIYMAGRFERY